MEKLANKIVWQTSNKYFLMKLPSTVLPSEKYGILFSRIEH